MTAKSNVKQQSLEIATNLFNEITPKEILHELDEIFLGYLNSEFANDLNARSFRVGTYFSLKYYFINCQELYGKKLKR